MNLKYQPVMQIVLKIFGMKLPKMVKKYVIGGIYRHPNQNVQNFTANMDVVLAKLSCQALPCVIAGDLNIDLCVFCQQRRCCLCG